MPTWKTNQGFGQFMQNPLVPQSAIDPYQQQLEEPQLEQSPWMARLKGFGSGALQGLRGLTSPLNLAGLAGTALGGGALMRGATALPEATGALSEVTPELVQGGRGISQVLPDLTDADAMIGAMKYNLAKVPQGVRNWGSDVGGWGSEAGEISKGGLLGGLGAGGAALLGLKKWLGSGQPPPQQPQAPTQDLNQRYNPLKRASDILNPSGGR